MLMAAEDALRETLINRYRQFEEKNHDLTQMIERQIDDCIFKGESETAIEIGMDYINLKEMIEEWLSYYGYTVKTLYQLDDMLEINISWE